MDNGNTYFGSVYGGGMPTPEKKAGGKSSLVIITVSLVVFALVGLLVYFFVLRSGSFQNFFGGQLGGNIDYIGSTLNPGHPHIGNHTLTTTPLPRSLYMLVTNQGSSGASGTSEIYAMVVGPCPGGPCPNLGQTDSHGIYNLYGFDGTYPIEILPAKTIPPLGPSEAYWIDWDWTPTGASVGDWYSTQVVIDYGDEIVEIDEQSQHINLSEFEIIPLSGSDNITDPDYHVENVEFSGEMIEGSLISFSGDIKNVAQPLHVSNMITDGSGTLDSTPSIRIDIGNDGSFDVENSDLTLTQNTILGLDLLGLSAIYHTRTPMLYPYGIPGSPFNIYSNHQWGDAWVAVPGTHLVEICADATNRISESNEGNNCSTAEFTIKDAVEEQPFECSVFFDNDPTVTSVILNGGSDSTTLEWHVPNATSMTVSPSDPSGSVLVIPEDSDPEQDSVVVAVQSGFQLTPPPGETFTFTFTNDTAPTQNISCEVNISYTRALNKCEGVFENTTITIVKDNDSSTEDSAYLEWKVPQATSVQSVSIDPVVTLESDATMYDGKVKITADEIIADGGNRIYTLTVVEKDIGSEIEVPYQCTARVRASGGTGGGTPSCEITGDTNICNGDTVTLTLVANDAPSNTGGTLTGTANGTQISQIDIPLSSNGVTRIVTPESNTVTEYTMDIVGSGGTVTSCDFAITASTCGGGGGGGSTPLSCDLDKISGNRELAEGETVTLRWRSTGNPDDATFINFGGIISGKDKFDDSVTITPPVGTTTYTYQVEKGGNTKTCSQEVTVNSIGTDLPDEPPVTDDPRVSDESSIPQTPPNTPTVSSSATPSGNRCPYFTKYLRLGGDPEYFGTNTINDPDEVNLVKHFLHHYRGEDLQAMGGYNGIYTAETNRAVRRFQEYYHRQVLVPWLNPNETSWYVTTRILANWLMGCEENSKYLRSDISPLTEGYTYVFDYTDQCSVSYPSNSYPATNVFNIGTPSEYFCAYIPNYCNTSGTPQCEKPLPSQLRQ